MIMNLPRRRLHQEIKARFSKNELRSLCFDLSINPEALDEQTIDTLVASLLNYTEKQGQFTRLLQLFAEERKDVNWSALAFDEVDCPYRGLLPFREEDAHLFYGRIAYTDRLFEAVTRQPLTAVFGPSGSGKSSVVFAGLVPRLRTMGNWQIVDCRPGNNPFQSLLAPIIRQLEPDLSKIDRLRKEKELVTDLKQNKLVLTELIDLMIEDMPLGMKLLIIIDQFEELYSQNDDVAEQQHFLNSLLSLANNKAITLLLTMRADFMGRALLFRDFADVLQKASQMIGPMNRQEMREVIVKPVSGTFVSFQPGLPSKILDDVGLEPGNLPLLEFALSALWAKQADNQLTYAAYEEIGKVEGALTEHAETFYATFAVENDVELIRKLFVQLVLPGDGAPDTRRKASRRELGENLWNLTKPLADARLLVTGHDENGDETVEIAHEALINHWQRLKNWMAEDRDFRLWQEWLRAELYQWRIHDEEDGYLLQGKRLTKSIKWLNQRAIDLSPEEKVFINRSVIVAAQQRNEANRAASDLAVLVGHEIKTPMTITRGYIDLLLADAMGKINEQQRMLLEGISKNTQRMGQQIQDLIDVSLVETGTLHVNISSIAFEEVINNTLPTIQKKADEKNIHLHLNLPEDLPLVEVDIDRMVQVLTKLLSNACKYSPPDSDVEVSFATRMMPNELDETITPMVICSVRDHGYGISEENLPLLFTKFFRADDPNIRQEIGVGLGLFFTKGVIELHGGKIWAESKIGEGTTVSFSVPCTY